MPKANKIVHLSTVHPVQDTRILYKEVWSLAVNNFEVMLAAQCKKTQESFEGIKILCLPTPKNRFSRFFGSAYRACKLSLRERADVYHFHDPELIPVGLLLRVMGKKVVYDVHEDLPRQILSKHWIPSMFRGLVSKTAAITEWIAAKFMSGIVAATPAIAKRFPLHKTVVVQNFPLLSEFDDADGIPYQERPMQIAYIGGITSIRGAEEMVRAMEYLPLRLEARLILAGVFSPPELQGKVSSLPGWKHVEYLGWQDRSGVYRVLASARVGVHVVHPIDNYKEGYPTKVFEYMAAGVPVVVSDFPLFREIVERTGAGLTVDPMDPKAIASAVRWLLENPDEAEKMGKRGREVVLKKYNWEREAQRLIGLYQRLLGRVVC